jgi:adenylylsulfate kinase-like enzyme
MVIWISGMPGTGKSTLAKYYYNQHKNKLKNLILIDGDAFRKSMGNDLGYTLKDRKKNALRLIKLTKYFSDQKVNVVISANLVFQNYRNWCKKNIPNFLEVYIESKQELLVKRNKKKNFSRLKKNVLGRDIKVKKPYKPHLMINNNFTKKKFLKTTKLIDFSIKRKKIKIY